MLTQYMERFEDGEPETVMVEQVKMKRVQKVIVRPHNEVCLVTKFGEHRLRARNKNDCMDWADAIAKWLDLSIVQTTQTKLNVTLHRAEGLKKADLFGKSDPYVKVKVNPFTVGRGQEHRTRTIRNTLDPEWQESFSFFLTGRARSDGHLQLELWDEDVIGKDDRLGHVSVALEGLQIANKWGDGTRQWYKVMGATGRVDITLALIDESEDSSGDGLEGGDVDPSAAIGGTDEERANALLAEPKTIRQRIFGMLAVRKQLVGRRIKPNASAATSEMEQNVETQSETKLSEVSSQGSYSSGSSSDTDNDVS